jgi:hypothetical protein
VATKRGRQLGEKMVRWLSPRGLFVTSVDVLLSGIFGRYSDKREIQGAIEMDPPIVGEGDQVWVDYVADLGDGWDSTYSIARLLARPHLTFNGDITTRGQFLVMGGDQVYPRAKWSEYRTRLVRPYLAASEHIHDEKPRWLFAIPGNHDWYDGLTSFMRIFRRNQMALGWPTPQQRSYFAIQLADTWWMLGIDLAFDAYIDDVQLSYFRELTEEGRGPRIKRGDNIILCTAKPSWAIEGQEGGRRTNRQTLGARALEDFEDTIVTKWGCGLPLVLSGDLHHYSRYRSTDQKQDRITFGGGGAYLYPTHHLRTPVMWGTGDSSNEYELKAAYPDPPSSKRLRRRVPLAAFANPSFGALVGGLYWLLATQMRGGIQLDSEGVAGSFLAAGWSTLLFSPFDAPIAGLLWILLLVGLFAFADAKHWWGKAIMAALHGAAYMTTLIVSILVIAAFVRAMEWLSGDHAQGWRGWVALAVGSVLLFTLGYVFGSLVMGLYLFFAQRCWRHANEAFAPLHLTRAKGFLRMKLDVKANLLWLYPIGVDRVCTEWELEDDVIDTVRALSPHLIEGPIPVGGWSRKQTRSRAGAWWRERRRGRRTAARRPGRSGS